MAEIWRDLKQRNEYEGALEQASMRNFQFCFAPDRLAVQEQIQIDRSRGIPLRVDANTPKSALYLMKSAKKFGR